MPWYGYTSKVYIPPIRYSVFDFCLCTVLLGIKCLAPRLHVMGCNTNWGNLLEAAISRADKNEILYGIYRSTSSSYGRGKLDPFLYVTSQSFSAKSPYHLNISLSSELIFFLKLCEGRMREGVRMISLNNLIMLRHHTWSQSNFFLKNKWRCRWW